jgi:hypothetical protein
MSLRSPAAERAGSRSGGCLELVVGVAIMLIAFAIYVVSSSHFDAGRPDLFYLADAFLHGRIWLDHPFGPWDNVVIAGRVYVPFAPFPAIALTPIVAIIGPVRGDAWEQVIDSALAAIDLGLCWWLMARLGVRSIMDRIWLVALVGFSTPIWWVTTRGGVWHTGHLIAVMLTVAALIEAWGRRRSWLLGLLVGAGFLTRAPLAFAAPFFAWVVARDGGRPWTVIQAWPWRRWTAYVLAIAPAVLFALWYNAARFGSPLESGYGLASLPTFLEKQRQLGLFSLDHLGMNLDYLFTHLPRVIGTPPFLRPDGLGMSIFLTSPGLLLTVGANWRSKAVIALGLTALAVLVPSLLYYGGGWLQYGYRYALDSIPFVMAIVGLAVARRGLPLWGKALIAAGVLVNLAGVYWAYNI